MHARRRFLVACFLAQLLLLLTLLHGTWCLLATRLRRLRCYISIRLSRLYLNRFPRELPVKTRQHFRFVLFQVPLQMLHTIWIAFHTVILAFLAVPVELLDLLVLLLRQLCLLLDLICECGVCNALLLNWPLISDFQLLSNLLYCRSRLSRILVKSDELLSYWVDFDHILIDTLFCFYHNLSVDFPKLDFLTDQAALNEFRNLIGTAR